MAAIPVRAPEQVPNRSFTPQYEGSFGRQSSVLFNIYDDATALLGQDALILDGYDLKELFESSDSREIIKIIGQHGVLKLGEMDVDVSLIDRGFKGRTTKTMGSSDLEVENWESMWIEKLMQGKPLNPAFADDRTVRVEAFAVTVRNASGSGRYGLLHPILKRWQAKACPIEVWGLPAIRAVVSFKWNHWAKRYLLMEFFLYALWTIVFMVEALTYKEEDLKLHIHALWKSGAHCRMIVVLSILSHVFMLPFTFIEIRTVIKYKTRWYSLWNVIDVTTQVIQVVCTVVYLTETDIVPNTFNLILAIQTILLLVKIQFFARAFVAVESSMLDMLGAVLRQLRWYLLVVVLTVYVFTVAIFILFRKNKRPEDSVLTDYCLEECDPNQKWDRLKECKPWECKHCDSPEHFKYCIPRPFLEFENIFRSVLTIYGVMLGAWQMEDYLVDVPYPMYSMFLFCLFMLIMSVLLYNLLIGMMIDSHARQMEVRKLWVHVSRAEIIGELETALPKFITRRYQEPFVHALRIIPPREASLESLWTQIGATETSLAASKEEFERELIKTEKEVMEAIDVISGRIRAHLGLTEEEYVAKLYSSLGISKLKTANTLKKMRSTAGSRTPFQRLKTLPVRRN